MIDIKKIILENYSIKKLNEFKNYLKLVVD